MLAYSAHDLDISYLLTAWNLNKGQLPISYAASLMIELLGPHPPSPITTYRLRFRYKSGWEDVSGKFLQLPSCPDIPAEEGCALTSALDQIDPYLLDDDKFFRECSMSGGSRRLRDSADCPVITSSSSATEGTQIRLKETHIMIIVVSSIFALCVISVSVAVAIRRTRDEIPFEQLL